MPRYNLAGRTVLITGSTGGLGTALARALRDRGANLALLDLDGDLARQQAAALGPESIARGWTADVRDLASLQSAIDDAAAHFDPLTATREFRIGVRLAGEMPRFSSLVSRVRREAPHVALASVSFRRRDLLTALANGDLDLVLETCDRVLLLHDGQIAADGPAWEILRDRALLERHSLELPFCLAGVPERAKKS